MSAVIRLDEYFGEWLHSPVMPADAEANAFDLLQRVNSLLALAERDGVLLVINPETRSFVSGQRFGGFRPKDCPEGAPDSAHKIGAAVDIYDPANVLDVWLSAADKRGAWDNDILARFDLYREHPTTTPKWCHLTIRAPKSRRRSFYP